MVLFSLDVTTLETKDDEPVEFGTSWGLIAYFDVRVPRM